MSYASAYEQTYSIQCCNLFISWLWTQLVIVLPSVARAWDDQSTVHRDWQLGGVCAMFERLTVLLRISIWFSCQFAGFHVANPAVTHLLLLRRCMKCSSVFLTSTGRSGQVIDSVFMSQFSWRAWPISCSRSTISVAAPVSARLRHICRTLCTGA